MNENPGEDEAKKLPEPGSAVDLFPADAPAADPSKDIEEKGEPGGGGDFA